MGCPPLLSSIWHPLHRLTGILQRGWISLSQLHAFLPNLHLHRIVKGEKNISEDAIRGKRFFYAALGTAWIVHTNPCGFDPAILTIAYEDTLHQRLAPDRY